MKHLLFRLLQLRYNNKSEEEHPLQSFITIIYPLLWNSRFESALAIKVLIFILEFS